MNATPHILVVEDERKIAALLYDYLVASAYRVTVRETGAGAIDWIRGHAPDAVLLDLMLPGEDGLAICRGVRVFSQVPMLMITARVEEIDRLLGLELGADDYICKPFSPREVVARVHAVLRRVSRVATDSPAPIELDEARFEARVQGRALALTAVEFRLLRKLAAQPRRVFSRARLIDALYGDHRVVSDRTADSHIENLRRKLVTMGVHPIASVCSVGYRFEWNVTESTPA